MYMAASHVCVQMYVNMLAAVSMLHTHMYVLLLVLTYMYIFMWLYEINYFDAFNLIYRYYIGKNCNKVFLKYLQ